MTARDELREPIGSTAIPEVQGDLQYALIHGYTAMGLPGILMANKMLNRLAKCQAEEAALPVPPVPAADLGAPYQARVKPWLDACFGPEIASDKIERNHRFMEEALELVQAAGCTQSEAHHLVDYVFGRPVGDLGQEVGGVMNTLAALCLAHGRDMHQDGETELARVWTKVDTIRAKQKAKPKHSPLPEHVPALAPQDPPSTPEHECNTVRERPDLGPGLSRAAADVLAERKRQVEVEGWTAEHDDTHGRHELVQAATCYADRAVWGLSSQNDKAPLTWPWHLKWWRPASPRRMLVKAGALIIAEIERLDRKEAALAAKSGGAP